MIDHHALYIKLKRKMIKSDIKKGDIYYASLNPVVGSEQKGERPVVVIQNNLGNKYSPTVIIAPLTEVIKKADLPTHITIFRNDFLKYDSMILLEQLIIFQRIEEILIKSMKRNLTRHLNEEKDLDMNWSAWQSEQLKALEHFKSTNRKMFKNDF